MNRNIIITGAGGFIGKYLVRAFLEEGDHVYSVVRKHTDEQFILGNTDHFRIESSLEELTADMFPIKTYDAFFHLGWHGVNREEINNECIHEKSFQVAVKCLELCHQLNCNNFLDVGTRAEYGNMAGTMEEAVACCPLTAYAKAKYHFYQYAREYTVRNQMRYIHFRVFSVIGRGDHPWSLITMACSNLKQGAPMYMGACDHLWNFMDVRDAVSAMYEVYENIAKVPETDNKIINIASHDTRILRSFIEEIRIVTHSKSPLFFDKQKKGEDMLPDISKLTALTGFQGKYSFSDTIKAIVQESN